MATTRYPQFCALARAAELVGERWTLLIVRELLLGPQRFSDLKARLDSISSSVLAQRLARLEEAGLVRRTYLEPPAASTVYELADAGRALEPVVFALIRWGARFLLPPRPGERVEPDWLRLALAAYARSGPSPAVALDLRITGGGRETTVHVEGGPDGTAVTPGPAPADITATADVNTVLALMARLISPAQALAQGLAQAEGDLEALTAFPDLFEWTRKETDR